MFQTCLLNISGLLQESCHSSSISDGITVNQQEMIKLSVAPIEINVTKYLLGLTWYHNGSVVVPNDRILLSADNKSLSIATFSSADNGVYQVQYNQLFIYPHNEQCQNDLLSLFRHHPIFRPVIFCVNMKNGCPGSDDVQLRFQEVSVHSVDPDFQGIS